jgi:hypothetical protein
MSEVAQKYQNELKSIKQCVKETFEYMEPNYKRFHEFRSAVFATSLREAERAFLVETNKPILEFNVGEAYLSRLLGEFSKQEPSIEVSEDPHAPESVDPKIIQLVEAHMRHVFNEARKDSNIYESYKDVISGGFSVLKFWTEYANPDSFAQVLKFSKVLDPTLCGFDPMAKAPTKHDGEFCFQNIPMRKDEFMRKFEGVKIDDLSFAKAMEGFNWSFQNSKYEKIIMVCEFYKKKHIKYKIVRLANGQVMKYDDYKKILDVWPMLGKIEQPPAIVGEPRTTEKEVICRYILIENQILSYTETQLTGFPLVYCPGNDIYLKKGQDDSTQLMTRPYLYHYMDAQRLKNFAGQCLANELQTMVQHKFMAAKEGIPSEGAYQDAYKNVQRAQVLVYNAYDPQDPSKQVPPPTPIFRPPVPPEIATTFMGADQVIQNILGSFDAALGINNNQLSGVAIVEGATQSNAVAMPYLVGFMQGLNRIAELYVGMMPVIMTTERSLPILDKDGEKGAVKINPQDNDGMKFDYSSSALHVKLEAGVNFAIQQNRTMEQVERLMQASPMFSQFMNQKGLNILLDNLSGVRGIEYLKEEASEWMKEQDELAKKQQQIAQQQAQAQAQQPNPLMIKMKNDADKNKIEEAKLQNAQMELQIKAQAMQYEQESDAAKIAVSQQSADNERLRIMMEAGETQAEHLLKREKMDTEKQHAATDLAIKSASEHNKHGREMTKLQHDIMSSQVAAKEEPIQSTPP